MSVVLPFPPPDEEKSEAPDERTRVRMMALELTRLRYQPVARTYSLLIELKRTHAERRTAQAAHIDPFQLPGCKQSGRR